MTPTAKAVEELAQKAVEALGEHAEAVQILATWTEDGKTRTYETGRGNWWARIGMTRQFVKLDDARELAAQIRD